MRFLTREKIDRIHARSLEAYGGLAGLRDPDGLESALGQPEILYHYGEEDVFMLAAAYAFHLAQSQAYVDGNKRTGAASSLLFLEINGVSTTGANDPMWIAVALLEVARGELDRSGLGERFREHLAPSP